MTFEETTWNEGAAPGISAEELNRIEDGILVAQEVEGWNFGSGAVTGMGTSFVNCLTIGVPIPSHWGQWKAFFEAKYVLRSIDDLNEYQARAVIAGSNSPNTRTSHARNSGETVYNGWSGTTHEGSFMTFMEGFAATGQVTMALQMRSVTSSGAIEFIQGEVFGRARRVQ